MNKIKYPTLKIAFIALTILIGVSANSATTIPNPGGNDLSISLGNLCEYVGQIQTDENGSMNTCSFLPTLSTSYDYFLTPKFALSPQLGATLPQSGRDPHIQRMTLFALLNTKYKTNYVNLIGGMGFYFTRIWGDGGEEVLNNGNTTDSFPLPKDPVYARNFIINLGLGLDFTPEFSGEIYTYLFNALKSEDRALSIGLGVSYHFGEVL